MKRRYTVGQSLYLYIVLTRYYNPLLNTNPPYIRAELKKRHLNKWNWPSKSWFENIQAAAYNDMSMVILILSAAVCIRGWFRSLQKSGLLKGYTHSRLIANSDQTRLESEALWWHHVMFILKINTSINFESDYTYLNKLIIIWHCPRRFNMCTK